MSKDAKIYVWLYVFLALISIFEVGSAGSALAMAKGETPFFIIFRQTAFLVIGFFTMFFVSKVNYGVIFKLAEAFYFFGIILLILTLLMGNVVNNARRWIEIPIIGMRFQTSEFVKMAVIIMSAKILSTERDLKKNTVKILQKIALYVLPVVGIIMLQDNSTAFLLFLTVLLMLFVSPMDKKILWKYVGYLSLAGFFLLLLGMAFGIGRMDTLLARIYKFLTGEGYDQLTQAKIAIATGQYFLPLPGSSVQKAVLSHSYSDFIFAIINEEWGLLGALLVIAAYLLLFYKTVENIKKFKRLFPIYLSLGLVFSITLQAFVHMGVNVGLLPVTGQPLPLISLGGSSIIITSVAFGLLINMVDSSQKSVNTIKQDKNNTPSDRNASTETDDLDLEAGDTWIFSE